MKVKIFFLSCLFFCCSAGILYSNPSDSNENNPVILPMNEKCGQYEFIFKLNINNKSKVSWDRAFSPKEYVGKAEKFVKENIGDYAKNWSVCKFTITALDNYYYYYVVSFSMIPENGIINGMPGVFNVYIDSSGEIDFVKK